ALMQERDIRNDETLGKHADWMNELRDKYGSFTCKSEEGIIEIIKKETGIVFSKVLEHAGVYKCNEQGLEAFERFIATL
ncbi:MAG: galactose-1-phosphate uridylyltransferase, partial [Treponema sp.]|nr:galactose-1-phosphate uridylyltransferase [Treponema sp.]